MITPENEIPLDDSQSTESDDQQSQKDVHSNGLDAPENQAQEDEPSLDMLKQAYDASEPSYTLKLDDE